MGMLRSGSSTCWRTLLVETLSGAPPRYIAGMAEVHYRIERPTPRARYIVRHILENVVGVRATDVSDPGSSRASGVPLLNYGEEQIEGAFNIKPSGGLDWAVGRIEDPDLRIGDLPVLFPVEGGDLPFDIFAASFFLLARLEELGPLPRDEHGRPRTRSMLAARMGWIDRPLVDEWGLLLAEAWGRKDPTVKIPARRYRHLVTMDVDNGFKYLGREGWRTLGAAARDLFSGRAGLVRERVQTLTGKRPDPYDVYECLKAMTREGVDRVIVNFLVAPRGPKDHAVGLRSELMRTRIQEVAQWAEVGIHPSYGSSDQHGKTGSEMTALTKVLDRPITSSRQHFLRMKLPNTYRELEALGIQEEHSMGFADAIGFRAGTCTPFNYYDALAERETKLAIVPFAVMDSAMAYKLNWTPEEAVRRTTAMVETVKRVGGTFSAVWHERFLSDHGAERGWRQAIGSILQAARS